MSDRIKEMIRPGRVEYVVIDARFTVLDASEHADEFAEDGQTPAVGDDARLTFPELAGLDAELERVLRGESPEWNIKNVWRSPEWGKNIAFDMTLRACPPPGENAVVLLLHDVTARARTEQALLQHSNEAALLLNSVSAARNLLERVFNSLSDGLCVVGEVGMIRVANTALTQLLGYHAGELIGKSVDEVLPALSDDKLKSPGRIAESTATHKQGEMIPVALSVTYVPEDSAFPAMSILLVRDLRMQKEAEREITRLKAERDYLMDEVDTALHFHGLVGTSAAMKEVYKHIEQVAKTDSTVLLLGETGTGKELVARAIHALSTRHDRLLVKVNCAVFQSSVVESELFGHEKGAFTGAMTRRIGRFEFANGGSILLDEVGELLPETQAKLLRVLQEQEFERVGGSEPIKVDVRVIAATNRDLEEAVRSGLFRDDLYFRINVFPIRIPPLRERREDIPLLAQHFVTVFSHRMNKRITKIPGRTMHLLTQYDWPGNVRELSAVIERAVILSSSTELDEVVLSAAKPRKDTSTLEAAEREHILAALRDANGIIEGPFGAARQLGINPSTLRSRMKKLSIRRPYE